MYGKFHASAFTGSMRGAGPIAFAVWAYVIANTSQHSVIELNPDVVAFLLGCKSAEVEAAIEYLCSPDPKSRCKDHEGRRLLKEGEFQYFVPTHSRYRAMKNTEEKREYNRQKKQEQRLRDSSVKHDVKDVKDVNTTTGYGYASDSEAPEGGTGGNQIVLLKEGLNGLYDRDPKATWTYLEESALVEVCRRPSCLEELANLRNYARANGKYFPKSVASLLGDWSRHLDAAASHKRKHFSNKAGIDSKEIAERKRIAQQALERAKNYVADK